MTKQIYTATLGSLFDGIGGFPYAGSFFGIEPLWASEILPQAMSVTKRHFPDMTHVGDITKLDGAKLPPVDIITFGSPCQDLSVAGRRAGLSGERSGLFNEAIRIIYEMWEATHGEYPTWAVWENVPGALSSNNGLDFQAVLEAFTKAEIPIPQSGRWANAGMVRSGGTDLAWCVYNAQYFGTAQRRRRIFLVRDFGGRRAGEILFVPKSLHGYFAAGGTPRQSTAAYALHGTFGTGGNITFACNQRDEVRDLHDVSAALCARPSMKQQTFIAEKSHCLTPWDVQSRRIHSEDGAWPALYGGEGGGHGYAALSQDAEVSCLTPWDTQQSRVFTDDGASPTLTGADGGGGRNPAGLVYTSYTLKPRLSGTPCLCEPKLARTITARGDGSPNIDSGPNIIAVPKPDKGADILCAATGQPNAEMYNNISSTLTGCHEQPIICGVMGVSQNQCGDINTSDTAYSLCANGNATGRNAPLIVHPTVGGTLMASGAGMSRPAGMASETDLCVVVPDSEPIPITDKATRYRGGGTTRNDDGSGNGLGVGKSGDPAPTLTSCDRHAVAAVFNRQRSDYFKEQDIAGTQAARQYKDVTDIVCESKKTLKYIVRRLTPMECERLQGYPDGWTQRGHDGKPISDTARYMMLGNSVAVPCVAYILMGIAKQMGYINVSAAYGEGGGNIPLVVDAQSVEPAGGRSTGNKIITAGQAFPTT